MGQIEIDWPAIQQAALRKPHRKEGDTMPRPIMVDQFGLYLGCHFSRRSADDTRWEPVWHCSISIHGTRGLARVIEWGPEILQLATRLAEKALSGIGDGSVRPHAGTGISLHVVKPMSGREIEAAKKHLR